MFLCDENWFDNKCLRCGEHNEFYMYVSKCTHSLYREQSLKLLDDFDSSIKMRKVDPEMITDIMIVIPAWLKFINFNSLPDTGVPAN